MGGGGGEFGSFSLDDALERVNFCKERSHWNFDCGAEFWTGSKPRERLFETIAGGYVPETPQRLASRGGEAPKKAASPRFGRSGTQTSRDNQRCDRNIRHFSAWNFRCLFLILGAISLSNNKGKLRERER